MRFVGRITEWNDAKGFGFVVPNGGATRAFVHISQFQARSRRPITADLISYLPVVDARGRTNAQQIRYVVAAVQAVRASSRMPRAALGVGALIFAGVACAFGSFPSLWLAVYLCMSFLSYIAYWRDKSSAQQGRSRSRTPEKTLHLVDLFGGWPGALIAQQQFHHKTVKQPFQFVFWLTVVLNLVACAWAVRSGLAAVVTRVLMG